MFGYYKESIPIEEYPKVAGCMASIWGSFTSSYPLTGIDLLRSRGRDAVDLYINVQSLPSSKSGPSLFSSRQSIEEDHTTEHPEVIFSSCSSLTCSSPAWQP